METTFDTFWQSYPRKVGKPAALKAWKKALKLVSSPTEILNGLERWRISRDWKCEPILIPHAATFLNQCRWQDVPIPFGQEQPRPAELGIRVNPRILTREAERNR